MGASWTRQKEEDIQLGKDRKEVQILSVQTDKRDKRNNEVMKRQIDF